MGRMQDVSDLIQENNWEYGAELGVAMGQTLFHVLNENPGLKMIAVDSYDFHYGKGDKYSTGFKEYDPELQETFRNHVESFARNYGNRLKLFILPTVIAAEEIENESLDFVFIDADHRESYVRSDIAAWLPKINESGFMLGHDWKFNSVKNAIDGMLPGYKLKNSL